MIVHPAFKNISFKEAERLLADMDQGECIVRPSSKVSDPAVVFEGLFTLYMEVGNSWLVRQSALPRSKNNLRLHTILRPRDSGVRFFALLHTGGLLRLKTFTWQIATPADRLPYLAD